MSVGGRWQLLIRHCEARLRSVLSTKCPVYEVSCKERKGKERKQSQIFRRVRSVNMKRHHSKSALAQRAVFDRARRIRCMHDL